MTIRKYSSRAQQTTLSSPITSGDVTMTVGSGANLMGGKTPAVGETYTVVIDPDTALEEIVDVSNYASGNSLTIARGRDGSTAVAHSAGAIVRHMVIGRDLQESNDHIKNETTAHGITLANLVKTTDTGTVTSTMLLDGTIVNADINASAGIVDTKLATISTASKVSNSATTAASANTASAIVARDASGNFTAGTVTANLTGNVTGNVTGSSGSTTGNAATATALATARTFQLTGDVEASGVTFDGTGNVSLTTVIGTGAIVNADVNASAGIAYSKLSLGGTITSADLVDGTIVATDIANGTITAAKMVTDPYARANHTGTQLAATVSDFDTQVRTSRLDQMAAPTASVAMNAQKITGVADPTLAQDASTKAYVDAQVNALVDGAPGTLNTLNEIATAISSGGSFESTVVLKSGSTMTGALTLSGAPTVDLHAATKLYVDGVAGSATAAAASATAAAASYDSFDDRYLGSKSTAPSVDNDGNALIEGALYWNSVSNAMLAWDGAAWASISSTADIYRYRFTASGGETSKSGLDDNGLTLSYIVGKEQVYLNGVLLVRTTDYVATNGTSIASLAALTAGDVLEIITFTPFEVANVLSPTLFDAKGDILVATSADTAGKLTVGTDGQVLNADSSAATGLAWVTPVTATSTTTLTNKTLTSPTLTSPTITNGTLKDTIIRGLEEDVNVVAAAATGTINIEVDTASIWYYTTNATANHTLNFRYSSSVSLNTAMAIGDAITIVWLNTNGATAYYPNAFQIDGSSVTPKVPAAITAGNASSIDAYSFTIIKTASATFTVLETQTKFA